MVTEVLKFSLASALSGLLGAASIVPGALPTAQAIGDEDGMIQVRSIAEVNGASPEITLGDVMVARGVDTASLESLRKVRLADTPKPGESRSFTAVGIEQVFRPHLRDIEAKTGEQISLRIPTRVTVVRKAFKLTIQDVEEAIKSQLKDVCTSCSYEISGLTLPVVPANVPSGSSWSVRTRGEIPKGHFSLPLEVNNDDGSKRTYWISGQLSVKKRMPVAARSIEIGERIRPEDFTLENREVTFATDSSPSEVEIAASIAQKQIAAGQIVWRSSIRRELAIKNGDPVRVAAGDDGWQVLIEGIAQNSGYIGDMVKVKIPRTQKMISGLLTEKGLVEVR